MLNHCLILLKAQQNSRGQRKTFTDVFVFDFSNYLESVALNTESSSHLKIINWESDEDQLRLSCGCFPQYCLKIRFLQDFSTSGRFIRVTISCTLASYAFFFCLTQAPSDTSACAFSIVADLLKCYLHGKVLSKIIS